MPRGDGTGPLGQGPVTGRGMGQGRGQGQGAGRGGGMGAGTGGECVCPKCGKRLAHQRGVPCTQRQCPDCGTTMTRAL
ncbi:MAG: DUF5320 domain-containing protein [Lentisphaeria bacterium]|nr:DUF5320 domain-containing protein [Lentisphaeria bacterium]